MKVLHYCFLILFFACFTAAGQNRVIVKIPTADQEADYIWRTLQDIKTLEGFNYSISLPKGKLIEELKKKSRKGELNSNDYLQLKQFVTDSVYRVTQYEMGYQQILKRLGLINGLIQQIEKMQYPWGFRSFKTYTVNLTLYGSGGSYNPQDSSIVVFTYTNGGFKQYENPANTLIHEIVHLGIEASIVQKYKVPHPLKERIVDSFVLLNFHNVVPEYRLQEMGENRIDPYLKNANSLMQLDTFVKEIIGDK